MVSLNTLTEGWLKNLFYDWYRSKWKPWVPSESSWHQYKFELFSGRWRVPVDKRIRSKAILRKNLLKFKEDPAKNVYYSVLKWLSPKDMRKRNGDFSPCLGGPLVVDIDIGLSSLTNYQRSLNNALKDVCRLIQSLGDSYGFSKFDVVFSGKKGFHVYVNDFDLSAFVRANPLVREKQEMAVRARILKKLIKDGFKVDERVTSDTRRVIRLPRTLHGNTGFLCDFVSNLDEFNLTKFLAFDSSESLKLSFTNHVEKFLIGEQTYGPFSKGTVIGLPIPLSVFLITNGFANLS